MEASTSNSLHLQKQEAQELQGISLKGGLRRANPTWLLGSQILCLLTVGDTPVNSHYIQENNGPTPQVVVSKLRSQLSLQQIGLSFRGALRWPERAPTGWVMLVQQIAESLLGNQCSLVSMNMKQETCIFCVHSHEFIHWLCTWPPCLWVFSTVFFCKQLVEPLTPAAQDFKACSPQCSHSISQGQASSLSEPWCVHLYGCTCSMLSSFATPTIRSWVYFSAQSALGVSRDESVLKALQSMP